MDLKMVQLYCLWENNFKHNNIGILKVQKMCTMLTVIFFLKKAGISIWVLDNIIGQRILLGQKRTLHNLEIH